MSTESFEDQVAALRRQMPLAAREPAALASVVSKIAQGAAVVALGFGLDLDVEQLTSAVVGILALGGVIETWLTRRNVWSPATVDAREVLIRRERRPIVPPAEDVMSSVEEDLGY